MPLPRRALLSVSDKSGLETLAAALVKSGVELVSTGGTARALQDWGCPVTSVAEVTGFPEILEGRVKTLHPAIHAALLADLARAEHRQTLEQHTITPFDLLVVNLYPFAETLAATQETAALIEQIDIGGPALLRAASKNHANLVVLSDPADYALLIAALAGGQELTLDVRRRLAAKAFAHTAAYDSLIARWLAQEAAESRAAKEARSQSASSAPPPTESLPSQSLTTESLPKELTFSGSLAQSLRYGENPHQLPAALYLDPLHQGPTVACAKRVQGKALSYNNLLDADAAFALVAEFAAPAVAIIKHNNPCGVAQNADLLQAYRSARACDPVSAFGGIVAVNRPLDARLAEAIIEIFTEVVVVPEAEAEALEVLAKKPNLRLLLSGGMAKPAGLYPRAIAGGFLVQAQDSLPSMPLHEGEDSDEEAFRVVTRTKPSSQQRADLHFAERVAKHVKSNAIVYARDGATLGIGAGQMSRLDACKIAAQKAGDAGLDLSGSVVASDAFFPFTDGLEVALKVGARAVIQPGGSQRDAEVIAAADAAGVAMVMSGQRHFRH